MYHRLRNLIPPMMLLVGLAALGWAVSFGTLPPADFSFSNGDEVKTVDPVKATGKPEGRIIDGIFEGLYRSQPQGLVMDDAGNFLQLPTPDEQGNVPKAPVPAAAESCEVSPDGKTYTFKIRRSAKWSDGSPVLSHDFRWSWRRMLHPETASKYAYQLYYISGAQRHNEGAVNVGDRIEVELNDRLSAAQTFPQGSLQRGVLRAIIKPPRPELADSIDQDGDSQQDLIAAWEERWTYVVELKPLRNGQVRWDVAGELKAFSKLASAPRPISVDGVGDLPVETCLNVLSDFDSQVGIRAPDDQTLVVTLNNPTPFFLDLMAFYPLYPVNRPCIEKHGVPRWTRAENIVSNGPYQIQFRRLRDRVRLVKNPHYWNAKAVRLNVIDAMAIKSQTTGLNMYLNKQLEWSPRPPDSMIHELRGRDDFVAAPSLITYFYRLNVDRPPLDDVHVRRALNLAIDKQLICEKVTKGGEQPARHVVPPGLAGYVSPQTGDFDPVAARAELAKSKYALAGRPLPKIQILYNTLERHRAIAEVIQQQWKNNLGIDAELRNSEWATYLDSMHTGNYTVARAGWIGDYPDPNTFLDMWVTGGENNETGWGNTDYDALIAAAQTETDPKHRREILAKAEELLLSELPFLPLYFYVMSHMVSPRVDGFFANAEDRHPLHLLRFADN